MSKVKRAGGVLLSNKVSDSFASPPPPSTVHSQPKFKLPELRNAKNLVFNFHIYPYMLNSIQWFPAQIIAFIMGCDVIKTLLCFELLSLCRQKLKELCGPTVTHIVYCGDYLRLGLPFQHHQQKVREKENLWTFTHKKTDIWSRCHFWQKGKLGDRAPPNLKSRQCENRKISQIIEWGGANCVGNCIIALLASHA